MRYLFELDEGGGDIIQDPMGPSGDPLSNDADTGAGVDDD